ncbi:hypothetical protein OG322_22765 [Streptomyces sp. NBC_01260]|nr:MULTISPECIES: hypothetical protein [unclassified Streptomyces]
MKTELDTLAKPVPRLGVADADRSDVALALHPARRPLLASLVHGLLEKLG